MIVVVIIRLAKQIAMQMVLGIKIPASDNDADDGGDTGVCEKQVAFSQEPHIANCPPLPPSTMLNVS